MKLLYATLVFSLVFVEGESPCLGAPIDQSNESFYVRLFVKTLYSTWIVEYNE